MTQSISKSTKFEMNTIIRQVMCTLYLSQVLVNRFTIVIKSQIQDNGTEVGQMTVIILNTISIIESKQQRL